MSGARRPPAASLSLTCALFLLRAPLPLPPHRAARTTRAQTGFMWFGAVVLIAIAVPVILPIFLPLLAAFYHYRQKYVATSREVKRYEAVTRSPVYAAFSATLKGLPTIRAYSRQAGFQNDFLRKMSVNGDWRVALAGAAQLPLPTSPQQLSLYRHSLNFLSPDPNNQLLKPKTRRQNPKPPINPAPSNPPATGGSPSWPPRAGSQCAWTPSPPRR